MEIAGNMIQISEIFELLLENALYRGVRPMSPSATILSSQAQRREAAPSEACYELLLADLPRGHCGRKSKTLWDVHTDVHTAALIPVRAATITS